MNLLVLGLNHRTAPLDLRERLTLEKDQLASSLELLAQYVEHGVILSTCNRLEVYVFDRSDIDLVGRVGAFLSAYSGVEGSQLETHLYQLWHEDCAEHLFRVSGGLDSMVVGERQVLGQVRSAFSQASTRGYARGPLSRLFHQALRAGRRIHRETDIGPRSVSQAGVQLARGILGDLTQQQALVIGAGDAGRLVARALVDAGVRSVVGDVMLVFGPIADLMKSHVDEPSLDGAAENRRLKRRGENLGEKGQDVEAHGSAGRC